jgi:hypothetical protein
MMTDAAARRLARLAALLVIAGSSTVAAQAEEPVCRGEKPGMQHVSRVHDRLRVARKRECETLLQAYDDLYSGWLGFKKSLSTSTGLEFTMDAGITGQWGLSGGGPGSGQGLFTPAATWTLFDHSPVGSGELQLFYTYSQYIGSRNAAIVQSSLDLNTPINDFPTDSYSFAQFSYTHTLPGDWLAVTFGQFPMYNFDGNNYAANQLVNFINYSMAQNGSSTYPVASLGAYVQINPTKDLAIVSGFQDANNVSGATIQTSTFGDGQYNWFVYGAWTPKLKGLGQSQVSLLYYSQPSVAAQPQATTGWSLNLSQAFGEKWGAFLRANSASSGSVWAIKSSVAAGGVFNNPLNRNPLDQIGLGLARNQVNEALYPDQSVRGSETVMEAYWAWTVAKGLQLTPDVQLTFDPALNPDADAVAVFSLRFVALF